MQCTRAQTNCYSHAYTLNRPQPSTSQWFNLVQSCIRCTHNLSKLHSHANNVRCAFFWSHLNSNKQQQQLPPQTIPEYPSCRINAFEATAKIYNKFPSFISFWFCWIMISFMNANSNISPLIFNLCGSHFVVVVAQARGYIWFSLYTLPTINRHTENWPSQITLYLFGIVRITINFYRNFEGIRIKGPSNAQTNDNNSNNNPA